MPATAPAPLLSEEDACKVAFVMAIKDALNVVSGKWKLAIVCTLLRGPRRFNEMERLLNGLTPRMLSRELRELEVNGVLCRVSSDGSEGRAKASIRSYQLTPSGQTLESLIVSMAEWGVQHRLATTQHGLENASSHVNSGQPSQVRASRTRRAEPKTLKTSRAAKVKA